MELAGSIVRKLRSIREEYEKHHSSIICIKRESEQGIEQYAQQMKTILEEKSMGFLSRKVDHVQTRRKWAPRG